MADNKTKPTNAGVESHLSAITDEARRRDCETLVRIMSQATGQPPRMWGDSIVGFGSYHYKYESGREGDMCITGFASRKRNISIYLIASGSEQEQLLTKLGKHKMGRACLNVVRLADIDIKVLQQLVEGSVAEVRRRYGNGGGV